jgi:hypothetical protein
LEGRLDRTRGGYRLGNGLGQIVVVAGTAVGFDRFLKTCPKALKQASTPPIRFFFGRVRSLIAAGWRPARPLRSPLSLTVVFAVLVVSHS